MPLWPEGLALQRPESEKPEEVGNGSKLVAGRPWRYAAYVSRPTMTIYPPKTRNNHAAILVLPGGGYEALAMDLEGTEICDWVTKQGMTCVLLKYRVRKRGATARTVPRKRRTCSLRCKTHNGCQKTIRAVCEDYRAAAGVDLDMTWLTIKPGTISKRRCWRSGVQRGRLAGCGMCLPRGGRRLTGPWSVKPCRVAT